MPIKLSRPLPSTPSSVTVIKGASGRYFASFVVDVESEPTAVEAPKIGVDLGLKHFAVLSDGTKIDAPRFLRKAEAKLKRLQRASRVRRRDRRIGRRSGSSWHARVLELPTHAGTSTINSPLG